MPEQHLLRVGPRPGQALCVGFLCTCVLAFFDLLLKNVVSLNCFFEHVAPFFLNSRACAQLVGVQGLGRTGFWCQFGLFWALASRCVLSLLALLIGQSDGAMILP